MKKNKSREPKDGGGNYSASDAEKIGGDFYAIKCCILQTSAPFSLFRLVKFAILIELHCVFLK